MLQQSQAIEWHGSNQANSYGLCDHRHPALERLVCAAISNTQLAEGLLRTPALALRKYEVGRNLSDLERRIVLSIGDAGDIYEFAGRLHTVVRQTHDKQHVAYDEQRLELSGVEPAARELHAAPAAATLVP